MAHFLSSDSTFIVQLWVETSDAIFKDLIRKISQSDLFLWFWEPSTEDLKIFDIDRTVENNSKYPLPSATVLVSAILGKL